MSSYIIISVNLPNTLNKPLEAAQVNPNNKTHLLHHLEKVMVIQAHKPQIINCAPAKCFSSDIIPHQGAPCSQRGDLPLGCGVL